MQVSYEPLPEKQRDAFCQMYPRGWDIVQAIELDLSRDPISRARKLPNGRYAQVFTPPVPPPVEIRLAYLVGNNILIKVFQWAILDI